MATESTSEGTSKSSKANKEGVAPAGGQSDSDLVAAFAEALKKPGSSVEVRHPAAYGRIALEVAIPTVIVVSGVVALVGVTTLIDNKWGNGSRVNRLIDKGVFNGLAEVGMEGGPSTLVPSKA